MTYLGVDQSLNATGICVISDEGSVLRLWTVEHASGGASDEGGCGRRGSA